MILYNKVLMWSSSFPTELFMRMRVGIQSPSSGACPIKGCAGPPLLPPAFSRRAQDPECLRDHLHSETGVLVPIFVTNGSLFSVRPHSPLSYLLWTSGFLKLNSRKLQSHFHRMLVLETVGETLCSQEDRGVNVLWYLVGFLPF